MSETSRRVGLKLPCPRCGGYRSRVLPDSTRCTSVGAEYQRVRHCLMPGCGVVFLTLERSAGILEKSAAPQHIAVQTPPSRVP